MKGQVSRRDFLKVAGAFSGGAVVPRLIAAPGLKRPGLTPPANVLIVVFDAFSACNVGLHGYGRATTPNLEKLAQRAIVYHNHYAGANWTVPGTGTLLTGLLPWTHRAFNVNQPVADEVADANLFHEFKGHHRIAYSHNPLVYTFLHQFRKDIDRIIPNQELFLTTDGLVQTLFRNDDDVSTMSWMRAAKKELNGGYSYSLFLSDFYGRRSAGVRDAYRAAFPRGLPSIREDNYYVLEQGIDSLRDHLVQSPQPFLAYFHFMPPHEPYLSPREFLNSFRDDGFVPPDKPTDADFSMGARVTPGFLGRMRRQYDEFILYVDREFARLHRMLEEAGVLDDTWIVLTSDHGELFERGIWKHSTAALYQPVIRVPLMIFEPGRTERLDIRVATSNTDVLPTLLSVTGQQPATNREGTVLPPFWEQESTAPRSIYAISATDNSPKAPLTKASTMIVRGRYKLTFYFGQFKLGAQSMRIELYDIESDPDELHDLYASEPRIAAELLDELKAGLAEADRPYL